MAAKTSAGILLFRRHEGGGVEVLLVHPGGPFWVKKEGGAWSIPKGEHDEAEEPLACALRELAEELGPAAPELAEDELIELGQVRQKSGKVVSCWAAEAEFDPALVDSNLFEMEWPPRSGKRQEFPEVDRAEWLGPEAAKEKINPAQAELIDRLLSHLSE
jgi:predicted NUDIX family NTP pyrophosphohydrolase